MRFVACPVYRDADSGKKSGCWLADDRATGMRYDVSQSPYKPDWNRAVLVEGRVASGAGDPCGGTVLDPVRSSILPDACPRHMLPAEGFPGRKFVLPARNVEPMAAPRPAPPGPYAERDFHAVLRIRPRLRHLSVRRFPARQGGHLDRCGETEAAGGDRLCRDHAREQSAGRRWPSGPKWRRNAPTRWPNRCGGCCREWPIATRTELAAQPVDHPDADGLPGQSQRRVEIRGGVLVNRP